MVTVWRYALRAGVVLACLSGVELAVAAPAQAAFTTEMSGLPGRFTAGEQVRTISAVVSQTDRRARCAKVRWSMVLSVQGASGSTRSRWTGWKRPATSRWRFVPRVTWPG